MVSDRLSREAKAQSEVALSIDQRTKSVVAEAWQKTWIFAAIARRSVLFRVIRGTVTIRSITRQITSITDLLTQIGIGNFAARAEVLSRDELGRVAQSLNAMLDNTLRLIQSEQERDAIQASIKKLLDEVSGVATGDLSVEAEVGTDFTGAIADSFNFMISQLREIVANVQEATHQVTSSASTIQQSTEHLSRGSEAQVAQIVETSQAIDDIAKSIQMVAASTQQSATVAGEARTSARRGTEMVHNTIDGMDRIRNQVQETARSESNGSAKARRKSARSRSLSATSPTERPSWPSTRRSRPRWRAKRARASRSWPKKSSGWPNEPTTRPNRSKRWSRRFRPTPTKRSPPWKSPRAKWSRVRSWPQQAGQALNEIDNVSNRLAELIGTISSAAKHQARGADALTKSMNEINAVTQPTATGTKQAATSVSNLAPLADELRGSVSTFKLPGDERRIGGVDDLPPLPRTGGSDGLVPRRG